MTNTVFVIGAGASREVNLPTGYELKGIITKMLDMKWDLRGQKSGDYVIASALRELNKEHGDINPHVHEAWHIRDALAQAISIDNFIDAHRDNEKIESCGKLAIVRSILKAEQESLLFFDRTDDKKLNFKKVEEAWFIPFFQTITENCGLADLAERFSQITLIVFNYDRCIEHFLLNALINYYKISEGEAADLVANIRIFHPYGKVGELPWQNSHDSMAFGEEPDGKKLLRLASEIKTFTEGTDPDSSQIMQIRECVENSERLVFLGFAFHELNMSLLQPTNISRADFSNLKCFATALGISSSDKEVISEQISDLFHTQVSVNMANVACKDLFVEYRRSLAFKRRW